MNVTLRHVRAAVGVAREGSFRRAADGLHLSQPASQQVLERMKKLYESGGTQHAAICFREGLDPA